MHETNKLEKLLDEMIQLQKIQFITMQRMYDALLLSLPLDRANKLRETHEKFDYVGPLPFEESDADQE